MNMKNELIEQMKEVDKLQKQLNFTTELSVNQFKLKKMIVESYQNNIQNTKGGEKNVKS